MSEPTEPERLRAEGAARDMTAFEMGLNARRYDEENSTLTDNPCTPETEAFRSWYIGYNYPLNPA